MVTLEAPSAHVFRRSGFVRCLYLCMAVLIAAAMPGWGQVDAKKKKSKATPPRPATSAEQQAVQRLLVIPEAGDGIIRLPLRFVILRNLPVTVKGVKLDSWTTSNHLARVVVPELNRIWRPARIEWALEAVIDQSISAAEVAAKQPDLQTILTNPASDEDGDMSGRNDLIRKFFDPTLAHPVAHTIHLFPYHGPQGQGFAVLGGNVAYLCEWTDRPSRGTRPPQRMLLVEPPPFVIGSLGRTCAHEAGHLLKLKHATEPGGIMGGPKRDYALVPTEITTAREAALQRAQRIKEWAK